MSPEKLVKKITHLEAQIKKLKSFEFGIQNTLTLAAYYTKRINKYQSIY